MNTRRGDAVSLMVGAFFGGWAFHGLLSVPRWWWLWLPLGLLNLAMGYSTVRRLLEGEYVRGQMEGLRFARDQLFEALGR